VTSVYEVDNPNISLAGVFPVQSPRVLLQRTPPGNRHGQHQGIQWRMVEAFANKFSRSQQDARHIWR